MCPMIQMEELLLTVLLLLLTLHTCRFLFHTQVMILMSSYYRLSSLAVAPVDGCCLTSPSTIVHCKEPVCKGQGTKLAG